MHAYIHTYINTYINTTYVRNVHHRHNDCRNSKINIHRLPGTSLESPNQGRTTSTVSGEHHGVLTAYFSGLCKGISPQNMTKKYQKYGAVAPFYSILGSWNSHWEKENWWDGMKYAAPVGYTKGLVNTRSWCKIQKCSRRLCPNSRASYIAMVVPVGGLAPTGTLGPPPEEVLRLLPALKATVVALTVMVIGEFIATYYQEAISELLTPLLGLIALRDASQTGQCILCLALVAGFNCISDITSLVLILSGERYIAGAKYFFSTECSGKVRVYDPTTQSMKVEVRELCSWQTVLGNSVLICALILEFLCCKWSIKAFRAYQADNLNAMDAMLGDAERMDRMDRMDRMGPGPTPMAEGEDRSRPPASAAQGFVPFSGQGQRLSWRMPRAVKKSEGIAGIACGGNLCENSVTLSLFARNIFSCKLRQNWSWML